MIKTILIKPDLSTEESIDEFSYQAFPEVREKIRMFGESIDTRLPDGSWLHTINTGEGTFITIHKEI